MTLRLPKDKFTGEDLVEIYRAFCTIYDLAFTDKDEQFIREKGIRELAEGCFERHPRIGTKFFIQNQGSYIEFHVSGSPTEENWEEKDQQFQELARQYLQKNRSD